MALLHRRRRDPLDGQMPSPDDIERALDDPPPSDGPPEGPPPGGGSPPPRPPRGEPTRSRASASSARARTAARRGAAHRRHRRRPGGRRARSSGAARRRDRQPARDARQQRHRDRRHAARRASRGDDPGALREHVRGGRESVLLCLVVDASGSMGARARLARVKGALLGVAARCLRAARPRRSGRVPRPRGPSARPARHAARARRGGHRAARDRRAHAAGSRARAGRAGGQARVRSRQQPPRTVSVILTDGRVQDPAGAVRRAAASLGRATDAAHVIDIEDGPVRLGLAAALAQAAGARLHTLTSPPRMPRTAA